MSARQRGALETRVSPEQLRQLIEYNPQTGGLTWKARSDPSFKGWNGRYAGRPALTAVATGGYLMGTVLDLPAMAHRVAWAIAQGSWPAGEIDHINGNRTDNRFVNLRCVSSVENRRNMRRRNSRSGEIGIFKIGRRWRANIGVNYRCIHLGMFPTKEAAIAARKAAEKKYGFHPNHGRPA